MSSRPQRLGHELASFMLARLLRAVLGHRSTREYPDFAGPLPPPARRRARACQCASGGHSRQGVTALGGAVGSHNFHTEFTVVTVLITAGGGFRVIPITSESAKSPGAGIFCLTSDSQHTFNHS